MKGKTVVITGSSKGLGKELARQLIAEGARVMLSGRDSQDLDLAAKELNTPSYAADVTKKDQVDALAAFTIKTFGTIDIWINNAGIWLPHASVEEIDAEKLREVFEVNVLGVLYGAQAALSIMKRQEMGGTILNIISTSGLSGRANSAGYAATKWAERGFTESLREECRGSRIRVIAVYPGGMQTSFFDEKRPEDFDAFMNPAFVAAQIAENLKQETPLEEHIIRRT